jgi:membrane protein DedA with SNARE-associated domain
MDYDSLLTLIGQYGYAALFFALWLGIVGMPIPDEVVVMTGGAVTANGLLQLVPAFFTTYLGVISGLSLGYVLGRFVGTPVLEKLKRKKNMEAYLLTSERLIHKYGQFALVISYFLPVVRHVVPYIVGLNKMPFRRYSLISFSTGLVWTLIFFTVGRFAVGHVVELGNLIHSYGIKLLWVPVVLLAAWIVFKNVRRKKKLKGSEYAQD